MEKSDYLKNFTAGLFFLGGIVMILMFIFTIGRDKGLTQPKFHVEVLYKTIGGLSEGAPVRLAGVTVGNVSSIDFLPKENDGRLVKVTLNIYSKYKKQLDTNATFSITTEGLLGEKLINISILEDGQKINLAEPIVGEDPFEFQDLATSFAGAAETFTHTSEQFSSIDIAELSNVMAESSKALLVTSKGINSILGELQDITKKSKRLFDRIEQKVIEGDLFTVF